MLVSLGAGCESAGMVGAVGHVGREKLLPPPSAVGMGTVQKTAEMVLGEGGLCSGGRRAGSGGTALHQGRWHRVLENRKENGSRGVL